MSLYTPRPFDGRDRQRAERLIAEYPFAALITSVDGCEPTITHLPLELRDGALWGHMARANPHWTQFAQGRSVATFHGPHAYVSPRWYEMPSAHVPTWNYAVVHITGMPELLDDDGARRVLAETMMRFDPEFVATPARVDALLPGIVAFRMPVARFDAKFKMSQNRTPADRAGVIAALADGDVNARAVADWMRTDE